MKVEEEILAQIKQYDTIIIHRHQLPIQMPMAHNVGWLKLFVRHFRPRQSIKSVKCQRPKLARYAPRDQR